MVTRGGGCNAQPWLPLIAVFRLFIGIYHAHLAFLWLALQGARIAKRALCISYIGFFKPYGFYGLFIQDTNSVDLLTFGYVAW